jgi:biotin carboxyl carrier protein
MPELNQPVRLLSAKLWAGFAALALVVAAAAVWATVASLPQHVSAPGVIVHGHGAVTVRAGSAGSLASFAVEPGATVHRGELLGTLAGAGGKIPVRAPVNGTVMSFLTAPGRKLLPGAPLVAIDAVTRPARLVLLVDSPREVARLAPGQRVDFGGATFGTGRIASVTPYPASDVDLLARFGTTSLPGAAGKPDWLVDVTIDSPASPAPALAPVSARVLVDHVRPYRLVFGSSR